MTTVLLDTENIDPTTFQCIMVNARQGYARAVEADDERLQLYFAASLCAYLDVLALMSPLQPDGSESDKPKSG